MTSPQGVDYPCPTRPYIIARRYIYLFSIAAGLPWLVGLPVSLLSAVALALVVRWQEAAPVE